MEDQQDIMVEGVTAFAPSPAASYRYVIELKGSKMSIRMEDRTSKKQWYKCDMAKTDYVSTANAIPDATVADYVKCFQDTLNSDLGDSDAQRKLYTLNGGSRRLELAVKIRVLRSTWMAKYTFDLDPVSVERIDILESKLHDQQDEVEKLRSDLLNGPSPQHVQLEASTKDAQLRLLWKSIDSVGFVVNGSDGVVKVCDSGLYTMSAIINSAPGSFQHKAQLLVNGKSVQSVYCNCSYTGGNQKTTSLSFTTALSEGDEVAVQCDSNLFDTSYLSIVRVGN
ncbi:hypothetical protein PR001_g19098 [Phytophthora rubi]|uniref:C1q domain-containing protein n=1 Tax=Phytophthora rubi TaxID=129364 RepID=A0A6A3K5U9_9STRA|nr:hypothetical protein PR002_g19594 [Phytophthora rubi]KAE8999283.1 hypothetical protein PR001_g19098 [Phytophthora rubi]